MDWHEKRAYACFSFLCLSIHFRKEASEPFDAFANGMKLCRVVLGLGCIFMAACSPFFPELPFSIAQLFKGSVERSLLP